MLTVVQPITTIHLQNLPIIPNPDSALTKLLTPRFSTLQPLTPTLPPSAPVNETPLRASYKLDHAVILCPTPLPLRNAHLLIFFN